MKNKPAAKSKEAAPKPKETPAPPTPAAPAVPAVTPPAGQVQDRAAAPAQSAGKGRRPDMNIYLSSEKDEKGFWPKIGVAWRHPTGNVSLRFRDGVKLDGKSQLFLKDAKKEQDRSNEIGA